MKKILFIIGLASMAANAQQKDIETINSEIAQIKSDISVMKEDIASIKSENIYYKNVFNINKPIIEQEKSDISVKITQVEGDSTNGTISIYFIAESLSGSKSFSFDSPILIDLEANQYNHTYFNFSKSLIYVYKLYSKVPVKLKAVFKDIKGKPSFIKLFRFRDSSNRETFEFRDLKVDWK